MVTASAIRARLEDRHRHSSGNRRHRRERHGQRRSVRHLRQKPGARPEAQAPATELTLSFSCDRAGAVLRIPSVEHVQMRILY